MPKTTHDFSGQTAIITGGGRGIGLEIGRFFAAAGADTWLVDADEEAVGQAAADAGCFALAADVSNTREVENVVEQIVSSTGRVDIVVNNAGILRDKVLWKLSDEDWDAVLGVHLGGTFRFTRACVPHFRKQEWGRVINVTSYTGLHGNIGQAAYAAAKAGIIGFTKTAAKELARFGVTVNAISPNARTRMIDSMPDEAIEATKALIPLARFADPSEIPGAIGFLASEEAAYVTGVILPVDGGLSI